VVQVGYLAYKVVSAGIHVDDKTVNALLVEV
jgi:hypothetical protein